MLRSIQNSTRESVIGKEEANKQQDELRQQFQEECQTMQQQFDIKIAACDKEINQLAKNCSQLELELQLRDADFRKETECLRENLRQAEQDREKLKETCKGLEQQKSRFMEEFQGKHSYKVLELEQELEEKERQHEQQLQDINTQSEEQLLLLKQFYE